LNVVYHAVFLKQRTLILRRNQNQATRNTSLANLDFISTRSDATEFKVGRSVDYVALKATSK
jgi:hypothetical protein